MRKGSFCQICQCTYSVIPETNRIRLPLEANLEIGIFGDLAVEEVEDRVRLGFGHTFDATREAGVHVDALPSGDGVDANDRMDGFDWGPADWETDRFVTFGLRNSAVDGGQALQIGLETRRK